MPLDYMICTAMFGSGVAMDVTIITIAHRLTEVLGKLVHLKAGCSVGVRVTPLRSIAVLPTAAAALRADRTGTGVFV